jgi:hypothetical protein
VPAINLSEGQGFGLAAAGKFIRVWLPPLYSLLLVPFFLVNSSPSMFVLANVVLGCFTLIFTWHATNNITKNFGVAVSKYLRCILPDILPDISDGCVGQFCVNNHMGLVCVRYTCDDVYAHFQIGLNDSGVFMTVLKCNHCKTTSGQVPFACDMVDFDVADPDMLTNIVDYIIGEVGAHKSCY